MPQYINHIDNFNITIKRNKLMEESRKLITPEIRELVDSELKKINKGEIAMKKMQFIAKILTGILLQFRIT